MNGINWNVQSMKRTWWTIPQRHHTIGIPIRLTRFTMAECACQSKVRQLKYSVFGYEYVGRLHISVQNLSMWRGKQRQLACNFNVLSPQQILICRLCSPCCCEYNTSRWATAASPSWFRQHWISTTYSTAVRPNRARRNRIPGKMSIDSDWMRLPLSDIFRSN